MNIDIIPHYKVLVQLVLMYGSETWTLTKQDGRQLGIFERRVLRHIFGQMEENGVWRKIYNRELYSLFKEPDIVKL